MITLPERVSDQTWLRNCTDIAVEWHARYGVAGYPSLTVEFNDGMIGIVGRATMPNRLVEAASGKSPTYTSGIIVHEITHHWMFYLGMPLGEGLPMLCEHQFFLEVDTPESRNLAAHLKKSFPPEYTNGLAFCLAAMNRAGGYRQYIAQVRRTRRLN